MLTFFLFLSMLQATPSCSEIKTQSGKMVDETPPVTLSEQVLIADTIIEGRVMTKAPYRFGPAGRYIGTRYVIEPLAIFAGHEYLISESSVQLEVLGGDLQVGCVLRRFNSGLPEMQVGQRRLLFLRRPEGDTKSFTLSSGSNSAWLYDERKGTFYGFENLGDFHDLDRAAVFSKVADLTAIKAPLQWEELKRLTLLTPAWKAAELVRNRGISFVVDQQKRKHIQDVGAEVVLDVIDKKSH
jgi:hypothetical protein